MNKLLQIGLISAIMATSGFAETEVDPGIIHNCGIVDMDENTDISTDTVEKIINYQGEFIYTGDNFNLKNAVGETIETLTGSNHVFKNTNAQVTKQPEGFSIPIENAFIISPENAPDGVSQTKIGGSSTDPVILSTESPLTDQETPTVRLSEISDFSSGGSYSTISGRPATYRPFISKHEPNAVNLIVDHDMIFTEGTLSQLQYGTFTTSNESLVYTGTLPPTDIVVSDGSTLDLLNYATTTSDKVDVCHVNKSLTIAGNKYFKKNPIYKHASRGKLKMRGAGITVAPDATLKFEADTKNYVPEYPFELPTVMEWENGEFTGELELYSGTALPDNDNAYTDGLFYYFKTTANEKDTYTRYRQNLLLPSNSNMFSYNNIKTQIIDGLPAITFYESGIETRSTYIFSGSTKVGIYSGPVKDYDHTKADGTTKTVDGFLFNFNSFELSYYDNSPETTLNSDVTEWMTSKGIDQTDIATYGEFKDFVENAFTEYFKATMTYETTGEVVSGASYY